jgi:hypothetical protein
MCKQLSLKKLKKIHKLEQEDLKKKFGIGLEFLGEVVKSGSAIFMAQRANNVESTNPPGDPLKTDPEDAKEFNILLDKHFVKSEKKGAVECVGKHLSLFIENYLLFIQSNDNHDISMNINHLNKIDSSELEGLIDFVKNA